MKKYIILLSSIIIFSGYVFSNYAKANLSPTKSKSNSTPIQRIEKKVLNIDNRLKKLEAKINYIYSNTLKQAQASKKTSQKKTVSKKTLQKKQVSKKTPQKKKISKKTSQKKKVLKKTPQKKIVVVTKKPKTKAVTPNTKIIITQQELQDLASKITILDKQINILNTKLQGLASDNSVELNINNSKDEASFVVPVETSSGS